MTCLSSSFIREVNPKILLPVPDPWSLPWRKWNECDDSWEWIQWKYICVQIKLRKQLHLQLFQVRKKQIDFMIGCLASISYCSFACQQSTRRVMMINNARLTGPYWSSLLLIFTSKQVWPQTSHRGVPGSSQASFFLFSWFCCLRHVAHGIDSKCWHQGSVLF